MPIDRKAAIRAYKDTPRPMGVGVIRNSANGKLLVVAGRDLPGLLNRHQAQLRMGGHPNRELQQDWNALGQDVFRFEVLDVLVPSDLPDHDPADELRTLEALWLDKLAPFEPEGYHRKPGAAR